MLKGCIIGKPYTPELLAPAGSPSMLHAAVDAGADAAYLGLQSFNARRNAENFDYQTFSEACHYAHLRGVRLYVAMNTIVFPEELEGALDAAAKAFETGADAFIVQDLGLALAIQRRLPGARLHASTQMSIHSESGVLAAAELGFSRVTLAREMSLGEVSHLCAVAQDCGIEVETFAHGALCICYSGQCLLSSMIGSRSANRGICAQPCRLEYSLVDLRDSKNRSNVDGSHLLSPRDLCTIECLEDLVDSGVSSLKIEGRMKSPEYAHAVVSVYRRQLDSVLDARAAGETAPVPCAEDMTKLGSVFSRGFSKAYLDGCRNNQMMSYARPNNRGQFVGRVRSVGRDGICILPEKPLAAGDVCEAWTKSGNVVFDVAEGCKAGQALEVSFDSIRSKGRPSRRNDAGVSKGDRIFRVRSAEAQVSDSERDPRISVNGTLVARLGEPLRAAFALNDDGSATYRRLSSLLGDVVPEGVAEGPVVEAARTRPVTAEDVYAHVDRLGQTSFALNRLDIQLDEGVGMGFSQLHHVRNDALDALEKAILEAVEEDTRNSAEGEGRSVFAIGAGSNIAFSDFDAEGNLFDDGIELCALATNPECARAAKRAGAARIYVPALNYRRGASQMKGMLQADVSQAGYPKHCTLVLGAISHDAKGRSREAECGFDEWGSVHEGTPVVAGSLDTLFRALDMGCSVEVGSQLPVVNASSLELMRILGANRVWLSGELSLGQIREIGKCASVNGMPLGIKVSGAQELMTCEHCILMSLGECAEQCGTCPRRKVPFALEDRIGYTFPVITDELGRSHLYNSVDLDNSNSIAELAEAGVSSLMVDTTLMDPEHVAHEVSRICAAIRSVQAGEAAVEKRKGTTTGHLHRPVS